MKGLIGVAQGLHGNQRGLTGLAIAVLLFFSAAAVTILVVFVIFVIGEISSYTVKAPTSSDIVEDKSLFGAQWSYIPSVVTKDVAFGKR